MKRFVDAGAANLFPAYFALVMATGIISIAAYRLEMWAVAWALLVIAVVSYAILWLLTLLRLARHFPRFTADLANHARGPGFFRDLRVGVGDPRQAQISVRLEF